MKQSIHRKAFTAFLQGIYEKVSKGVDFVLARKINTFASENTEPYATWERIDRMDNNKGFIVRRLSQNEIPTALELAWKVFSEYESPDYAPEGRESFASVFTMKNIWQE